MCSLLNRSSHSRESGRRRVLFSFRHFMNCLNAVRFLRRNPGIPIYGHTTFEVPDENKQHILDELHLLKHYSRIPVS